MSSEEKKAGVVKYFVEFPKWAVWMIVIGVPLVFAYGIGLILIIIGIVGLVNYFKRPTDQQMDLWTSEEVQMVMKKALSKQGIDDAELVGDAIPITGPRLWDTAGAPIWFRKGKDGVLRYTPVNVTILSMTQNQLLTYQCVLDLTTGNPMNESTDEYFYKDVVSVATKTESITKQLTNGDVLQMNTAETFVLTTSGGTSVQVLLRDPKLIEHMGGGEIPTSAAERAIQSVRKMLREKKSN